MVAQHASYPTVNLTSHQNLTPQSSLLLSSGGWMPERKGDRALGLGGRPWRTADVNDVKVKTPFPPVAEFRRAVQCVCLSQQRAFAMHDPPTDTSL